MSELENDSIALSRAIKSFLGKLEIVAATAPELHQTIADSLGDSHRQLHSLRSFCSREKVLGEVNS